MRIIKLDGMEKERALIHKHLAKIREAWEPLDKAQQQETHRLAVRLGVTSEQPVDLVSAVTRQNPDLEVVK
jgi:hypothetical protein